MVSGLMVMFTPARSAVFAVSDICSLSSGASAVGSTKRQQTGPPHACVLVSEPCSTLTVSTESTFEHGSLAKPSPA